MLNFREPSNTVCFPLYKYYGNLANLKNAIENKQIHLELPSTYNDIFDSSFIVDDKLYSMLYNTKSNLISMVSLACPEIAESLSRLPTSKKSIRVPALIEELCLSEPTLDKDLIEKQIKEYISKGKPVQAYNNKISCFSETNDSLLMWAYYANNYSGACLEFNFDKDIDLKNKIHKVNYSTSRLSNYESFDVYFWKSIQWSHEQEWRLVVDCEQDFIKTTSINAVILGARMDATQKDEIISLAREHKIKIFESFPANEKYELEIKEI